MNNKMKLILIGLLLSSVTIPVQAVDLVVPMIHTKYETCRTQWIGERNTIVCNVFKTKSEGIAQINAMPIPETVTRQKK